MEAQNRALAAWDKDFAEFCDALPALGDIFREWGWDPAVPFGRTYHIQIPNQNINKLIGLPFPFARMFMVNGRVQWNYEQGVWDMHYSKLYDKYALEDTRLDTLREKRPRSEGGDPEGDEKRSKLQ
jgi:hypothetical protein